MSKFDCSELFPGYEKADCEVTDNFAVIRIWQSGTYSIIGMNVDKVQNFLERCRASQNLSPSAKLGDFMDEPF